MAGWLAVIRPGDERKTRGVGVDVVQQVRIVSSVVQTNTFSLHTHTDEHTHTHLSVSHPQSHPSLTHINMSIIGGQA